MQHFLNRPACTKKFRRHAHGCVWLLLCVTFGRLFLAASGAAPLLEEGFNYPAGSNLATNSPWAGSSGASISIVNSNLSLLNLRDTVPSGNMLKIGGGTSRNVYRNFSSNAVTGGAVYFAALFRCTLLPTNAQFVASLMSAGNTSPNQPDDPLDLYITTATNGCTFRIGHNGNDPVTASRLTLAVNTTHFIVLKYAFGSGGRASLYVDPAPGGTEPATPNAGTELGEGTDAANLQILLFHAPSAAAQGSFNFDTLRIGTNWADVTPMPNVLAVSGPTNQAVCAGTPVTFTVSVVGTPPFSYGWRTNGTTIANATNSFYTLTHPAPADAATFFDVVVTDAFNSTTSSVAAFSTSTTAPQIVLPPANQVLTAGTDATFAVGVTGDAPLTIQWRTNGTPIPGATNGTFTVTAPTTADTLNAFDVVASNPCGTVTSSPPAFVVFPTAFFNCDALPGFFGGMNLIAVDVEGTSLFAWSCTDPGVPVPNWILEGQLSEQPLNDGSGNSRYTINVNPLDPLVYYLIGTTTAGPYVPDVPVNWITTDISGNNAFFAANYFINANGVLQFPTPPYITQSPLPQTAMVGQPVQFIAAATGTEPLSYQWFFNNVAWPAATNAALQVSGLASSNAGNFSVVVTNNFGAATSSVAALTILPTPRLTIQKNSTGIKLTSGAAVPGDVYRVLATTNLQPPVSWQLLASGLVASNGLVQFTDPGMATNLQLFYRLALPSAFPTAPSITQSPTSRTVLAGQVFSFNVMATGSDPLNYQWFFNTNTILANGPAATLTLTGGATGNAGSYFVVVTNYSGSVTSSVATLTVLPPLQLTAQLTAAGFQLSGFGVPGDAYQVQGATSLVPPVAWLTLTSKIAATNGLIQFSDSNTASRPCYFYRLISP